MLYHYTSLSALDSILKGNPSDKGICFWATRYDCFGDHNEYKLGVETIQRLLPELEKKLQPDRRIAHLFNWNEINANKSYFWPYVVSFTSRYDNQYMWEQYGGHGKGVVLAIDDTKNVKVDDVPMLMLKQCIYESIETDDKVFKEIETEFYNAAFIYLTGPQKENALTILTLNPQLFVRLIGLYLLSYVAPRIKKDDFYQEEETRAIICSPLPGSESMFMPPKELSSSLQSEIDMATKMMATEKSRKRENGEIVYYKELYIPSYILDKVYIKEPSVKIKIDELLHSKGFEHIRVESL